MRVFAISSSIILGISYAEEKLSPSYINGVDVQYNVNPGMFGSSSYTLWGGKNEDGNEYYLLTLNLSAQ